MFVSSREGENYQGDKFVTFQVFANESMSTSSDTPIYEGTILDGSPGFDSYHGHNNAWHAHDHAGPHDHAVVPAEATERELRFGRDNLPRPLRLKLIGASAFYRHNHPSSTPSFTDVTKTLDHALMEAIGDLLLHGYDRQMAEDYVRDRLVATSDDLAKGMVDLMDELERQYGDNEVIPEDNLHIEMRGPALVVHLDLAHDEPLGATGALSFEELRERHVKLHTDARAKA